MAGSIHIIEGARKRRGMSQKFVAEKVLKVSARTYRRWLSGNKELPEAVFKRFIDQIGKNRK